MKNIIHFSPGFFLIPLFLSACGGSSSDENTQTVRINGLTEVSVEEGSASEFSTQNNIKSITAIEGDANLTLSFSGRSLIVEAAELTSPAIGTYDVYMSKGEDTLIQRYEVVGVNTSASAFENIANEIRENYQSLLDLAEDKRVYRYFIDLAYLSETITPSDRDARIGGFDVTGSPSYAETKSAFDSLLATFDAYLDGSAGEASLKASVSLAEQELSAHSAKGLAHLRSVQDLSSAYMSSLPDNAVEYVDSQGRFSRFFDESMVSVDPDTQSISYTADFEILTPLTGF